jgi:hypothetical protein
MNNDYANFRCDYFALLYEIFRFARESSDVMYTINRAQYIIRKARFYMHLTWLFYMPSINDFA